MTPPPATGPAPEPAVVRAYADELLEQQRAAAWPAALLGAVLVPMFAILDWFVVPQAFGLLLGARLLAAALLLLFARVAARSRLHPLVVAGGIATLCLLPIQLGVFESGEGRSPYVAASLLVLAGLGLVVPQSAFDALRLQALGLAIALAPLLPRLHPGDALVLAPGGAYLVSMSVIGVAGAQLQDRLRRREHRARAEVARQAGLIEMGTMAGALAHELAAPLTCALLDLDGAGRDPEGPGPGVESARKNLRRMGDILAAMQQGARRAGAEFREVDLARQIELALGLAAARAGWKHGVERTLEALPPVECEPTLVGQVLVNLFANAFEVARRRVRVAARCAAGAVVIEVEDDGPGVPEALRSRIFEPFFTTKGARGNGLGLWISAEIARLHGGSLAVLSAPSGGALFRLTLPERARRETPRSLPALGTIPRDA